jgi:hypothetical protein
MALGKRLINTGGASSRVGEFAEGGIIFYDDGAGGGLVIQTNNLLTGYDSEGWGCTGTSIATSTAFGTGLSNSNLIAANCGTISIQAKICLNLTTGGYSDWYHPSKDELQLMNNNVGFPSPLGNVAGLTSTNYSCSSQSNANNAWMLNVGTNVFGTVAKNVNTVYTRAIRSF